MKQYFYIDSNNQQIGPISEEALIALLKCGAISRQTLIWTESLEGWLPFGEVFPNVVEEIPPANAPEPTAATIARKPRRSRRKSRNPLIIGGALALVVALSFSAYFASEDSDSPTNVTATTKIKKIKRSKISKEKAIDELRELGVISSELDILDKVGDKAMAQACKQGNYKIVELLIAAGANADVIEERASLHGAAENGHADIVKLLLSVPGVDVNESNMSRETPLMLAARRGHVEVVKVLLTVPGIDVNKVNKSGQTPLNVAASSGHIEVVKVLLTVSGIDVNKASNEGSSPLYNAFSFGIPNNSFDHAECVKLLLAAPGINKDDSLCIAAHEGYAEIVKSALAAPEIDVNKVNKFGFTPLQYAAGEGHTECVKLLLAAPGINVNKEGEPHYYSTPLYRAAKYGHAECVKLLLAAPGIDVITDNPLYHAAKNGHAECVKLLLTAPGINVNKAVYDGDTPISAAASAGHTECVKLLRAAGAR